MRTTTLARRCPPVSLLAGLLIGAWLARHAASPAVRAWSPGAGVRSRRGALGCREHGRGTRGVVLLHGVVSSGDQFGRGFDSLGRDARVLVPDLLGFGRSFDPSGRAAGSFGLDDHVEALEGAIQAAGLGDARLVVAGHSMGAMLAMHLAARRSAQVDKVVMWSAPVARDRRRARQAIRRMGLLERLFALDGRLSRAACHWMCRHRTAAALVAMVLNPSVPSALALGSVRHTWPAYRDSMDGVVLDQTWRGALQQLCDAGVPVLLAAGEDDDVADAHFHRQLARRYPNVSVRTTPGAGHLLPITDPEACVAHITGVWAGAAPAVCPPRRGGGDSLEPRPEAPHGIDSPRLQ